MPDQPILTMTAAIPLPQPEIGALFNNSLNKRSKHHE